MEDEVCELIQARAEHARVARVCEECGHEEEKYDGKTMERDDLTHDEWLEHLQQELMDAVIYLQRLRTREQTLEEKLREFIAGIYRDDPVKTHISEFEALLDEVSE